MSDNQTRDCRYFAHSHRYLRATDTKITEGCAGIAGVCSQCVPGRAPSSDRNACEDCTTQTNFKSFSAAVRNQEPSVWHTSAPSVRVVALGSSSPPRRNCSR